jgi:hypothetical protein
MSLHLTLVHSAPAYLRAIRTGFSNENPDKQVLLTSLITKGLDRIRNECRKVMNDQTLKTSILYNAFTEAPHGIWLKEQNYYGFDEVYADSGGLQMVTRGLPLTAENKLQIYETQKAADFGFCFDEIPLKLKEGIDPETGKHRALTDSKLFHPQDFQGCAEATAQNVRNQCEAFEGTDTKAFYIVQGNTIDEMYRWFESGVKIVGPDLFKNIQGVAPADTCMGNGELESTDMLVGYHRMVQDFGPEYTKKHIHLLGVGSPSRLMPAVLLKQSGFIPADVEISFDSSTQSMAYAMGNYLDSDGTRTNKIHQRVMRMFSRFYDDMEDLFLEVSPDITKEWYLDYTEKRYLSISDTIKQCPPEFQIAIRGSVTLMCIWQGLGLYSRLKADLNSKVVQETGLGYLSEVKTLDDYQSWKRQFERFMTSKRIDRKINNSLMDMFE